MEILCLLHLIFCTIIHHTLLNSFASGVDWTSTTLRKKSVFFPGSYNWTVSKLIGFDSRVSLLYSLIGQWVIELCCGEAGRDSHPAMPGYIVYALGQQACGCQELLVTLACWGLAVRWYSLMSERQIENSPNPRTHFTMSRPANHIHMNSLFPPFLPRSHISAGADVK